MIRMLRYAWNVDRRGTLGAVGTVVSAATLGVALIRLIGAVIGELPRALAGDGRGTLAWLLIALLVVFAGNAAAPVIREFFVARLGYAVRERLPSQVASPMLAARRTWHLQDAELVDQWRLAWGHSGQAIELGVRHAPGMLGDRLAVLGALSLVGWFFSWWIALLLLVLGLVKARWTAHWFLVEDKVWSGRTEQHRRADYLFGVGTGEGAQEVRVFGLRDWLPARYAGQWAAAIGTYRGLRGRLWLANVLVLTGYLVMHLGAIWLAVRAAQARTLDLEALAIVIPAITGAGMSGGGDGLVLRGLPALRALRDLPRATERSTGKDIGPSGPSGPFGSSEASPYPDDPAAEVAAHDRGESAPAPDSLATPEAPATPGLPTRAGGAVGSRASTETGVSRADGPASRAPTGPILFEDVGFGYPGSSAPVLDGLRLRIGPGRTVALVGINGAGKSTLVKLLTATLRPTSGRITVGGIDLASLGEDEISSWQRGFAIVDQHFLRLPLTRDENVDLAGGSAATRGETPDLELPHRGDTVLDPSFGEGVNPSGGEWQRIALARASAAIDRGAERLVLDEPAAALDVRAEATLVDRYLELADERTVLVISHRLSVVRGADRICVLREGRIVEQGNHAELMNANGHYARMFRLQATRLVGDSRDPDSSDTTSSDTTSSDATNDGASW